jgi:hypothetical protein
MERYVLSAEVETNSYNPLNLAILLEVATRIIHRHAPTRISHVTSFVAFASGALPLSPVSTFISLGDTYFKSSCQVRKM